MRSRQVVPCLLLALVALPWTLTALAGHAPADGDGDAVAISPGTYRGELLAGAEARFTFTPPEDAGIVTRIGLSGAGLLARVWDPAAERGTLAAGAAEATPAWLTLPGKPAGTWSILLAHQEGASADESTPYALTLQYAAFDNELHVRVPAQQMTTFQASFAPGTRSYSEARFTYERDLSLTADPLAVLGHVRISEVGKPVREGGWFTIGQGLQGTLARAWGVAPAELSLETPTTGETRPTPSSVTYFFHGPDAEMASWAIGAAERHAVVLNVWIYWDGSPAALQHGVLEGGHATFATVADFRGNGTSANVGPLGYAQGASVTHVAPAGNVTTLFVEAHQLVGSGVESAQFSLYRNGTLARVVRDGDFHYRSGLAPNAGEWTLVADDLRGLETRARFAIATFPLAPVAG